MKQEGPGQAQEVGTWQSHEVQHGQGQGPAPALGQPLGSLWAGG